MNPTRLMRTLAAALAITAAVPAFADHYPEVRPSVRRRDRAVLDGLRRLTFAYSADITVEAMQCSCMEPTCDGGFMVACGGEVLPGNAGFLSAARRTSRETCLVCGCAGPEPVTLRATPVCIGF